MTFLHVNLADSPATLGDVVGTYERLEQAGIRPVTCINHGPTTSMYYADPDGNQVELQVDNYETVEAAGQFFTARPLQPIRLVWSLMRLNWPGAFILGKTRPRSSCAPTAARAGWIRSIFADPRHRQRSRYAAAQPTYATDPR